MDLLGFADLPKEIARVTGFEEDFIRQEVMSKPFKNTIDLIAKQGHTVLPAISHMTGSDSYLICINSVFEVFMVVFMLTTIRIRHEKFKLIPLEIAIDVLEVEDEDLPLIDLPNRSQMVEFLKRDLLTPYRKLYRKKYGRSLKHTFVIIKENFKANIAQDSIRLQTLISMCNKFLVLNLSELNKFIEISKFLSSLGFKEAKSLYNRIDELFIPPREFCEIKKLLQDHKTTIIIGSPEFGKTYTAVRLLWEYHIKGYNIKWKKGQFQDERIEQRKDLVDLEEALKPKSVYYFEDPFGRYEYEKNDLLESRLMQVISNVRNIDEAYIIITSREEVYKQFQLQRDSYSELSKMCKIINLKNKPYTLNDKKNMMLLWSKFENCKWMRKKHLRELILETLENHNILSTPLSIKDFVMSTKNATRVKELRSEIISKSRTTAENFAAEITRMEDDKILFLAFLFIRDRVELYRVRTDYQALVNKLGIDNAWTIDKMIEWFENDKIHHTQHNLSFSHESYAEAFQILLENKAHPHINKIIKSVTLELFNHGETIVNSSWRDIAGFVAKNYTHLDVDLKNILVRMLEKSSSIAKKSVAESIRIYYDKLPNDTRNSLLRILIDEPFASRELVECLISRYRDLPSDLKRYILSCPSNLNGLVAHNIIIYYEQLPDEVRNLISVLMMDEQAASTLAFSIISHYEKLPESVRILLFTLAKNDFVAPSVGWAIFDYYDMLPSSIVNELLYELTTHPNSVRIASEIIMQRFTTLPKNIQRLLFKIAGSKFAHISFGLTLPYHFPNLQKKTRNRLLWILNKNREGIYSVPPVICAYYDQLPLKIRNLLPQLARDKEAAGSVARSIIENYDRLPDIVTNLLPELAKDKNSARSVAGAITYVIDKLPRGLRYDLLLTLSENMDAAGSVAWILKDKWNSIPPNIKIRFSKIMDKHGMSIQS